jgi:hypothetical protein
LKRNIGKKCITNPEIFREFRYAAASNIHLIHLLFVMVIVYGKNGRKSMAEKTFYFYTMSLANNGKPW